MPILAAISCIGSSLARRAISRSVGNVTAMPSLLLSCCQQARKGFLAPLLGRFDLVEREHVQSGHLAIGRGKVRKKAGCESTWVISAGLDHSQEPVGMPAQEAR